MSFVVYICNFRLNADESINKTLKLQYILLKFQELNFEHLKSQKAYGNQKNGLNMSLPSFFLARFILEENRIRGYAQPSVSAVDLSSGRMTLSMMCITPFLAMTSVLTMTI